MAYDWTKGFTLPKQEDPKKKYTNNLLTGYKGTSTPTNTIYGGNALGGSQFLSGSNALGFDIRNSFPTGTNLQTAGSISPASTPRSKLTSPTGMSLQTAAQQAIPQEFGTRVTPSAPAATTTAPPPTTTTPRGQWTDAQRDMLSEITQGTQNLQSAFDAYKKGKGQPTYPDVPKREDSEYLKFMKGLQDPEGLKMAYQSQAELARMTSDEIARTRKEQERIQENEAGMIERGQTFLRQDLDRESAKSLADMAIAQGYNTDIINQQMAIGASIGEAQEALRKEAEAPLSYEEAAALGLPFGTTMAEARQQGVVPPTISDYTVGEMDALAQMVSAGQISMENIPASIRGSVAELVQAGGGIVDPSGQISPYQMERITRNLNSIDDLMGQVSGWTTGMGSLLAPIPGTPAANFRADVNTLAANIAFGELTAMREASKTGGALGQVSNIELKLLESALGSLDRAQSPEQFRESLRNIKESIDRWMKAVNEIQGTEGSGLEGNTVWDSGENWN